MDGLGSLFYSFIDFDGANSFSVQCPIVRKKICFQSEDLDYPRQAHEREVEVTLNFDIESRAVTRICNERA